MKIIKQLNEDLDLSADLDLMDDDSFKRVMNKVLGDVSRVIHTTATAPDEVRMKASELVLPDLIKAAAEEDKQNARSAWDKSWDKAIKAQKETQSIRGLEEFQYDLKRSIASQIRNSLAPEETYAVSSIYDDPVITPNTILRRGEQDVEQRKKEIPVLQVYMDCSSSYNATDIENERKLFAALLKLRDKGLLKLEYYYFADHLYDGRDPDAERLARNEICTDAWPFIIRNIKETKPTNVVLITDGDMRNDVRSNANSYLAPGFVWYIWKKTNSKIDFNVISSKLSGAKGTREYYQIT